MTESAQSRSDGRLRWYQRTWLWVVASVVGALVALVSVTLAAFDVGRIVFAVVGLVGWVLVPVGLWMGALVAERRWVSGFLSISTIVVVSLATWAVWNYLQGVEHEAYRGCELVFREELELSPSSPEWLASLPPEYDPVLIDPRECARVGGFEGRDPDFVAAYAPALEPQPMSMEPFRLVVWISFGVFWVAPLFVLYFLRRRVQLDNAATVDVAEVAAWIFLMVGAVALVLTVVATVGGSLGGGEAFLAVLWVVLPVVAGVLLMRVGRRRRAVPPDQGSE